MHLDLIGDREIPHSIHWQVAAADISRAVAVLGRLKLEARIENMRRGNVYVMPSLRECGGLALLDAMAIGLPFVACNRMGPAEYRNERYAIPVDLSSGGHSSMASRSPWPAWPTLPSCAVRLAKTPAGACLPAISDGQEFRSRG